MTTIHVAALLSLSVGFSAFGQQAVQWKVSDGGNGHWYQLRSFDSASWIAHRDFSVALGGHLATISNLSEDDFVKALIPQSTAWLFGPSIGLVQQTGSSEPAGGWGWVTGEPFSYSGWHPGEPNNGPGYGEHWVRFRFTKGLLAWNDVPESVPGGEALLTTAVVEWSADCNNDGIVDYGQCRDGSLPDYNGNNIPDCCERGEACVVGSYPIQWRVSEGGNGHWYQGVLPNPLVSWHEANTASRDSGGHLVSFTSAAEHDFIYQRIAGNVRFWHEAGCGCLGVGPWIGLRRIGGTWAWTTGEAVAFTSWHPGEPWEPRDYVRFFHYVAPLQPAPYWDNADADESTGDASIPTSFIVEWSADCNNDGVVDKGQILTGQFADSDNNGAPDVCECVCDVFRDGAVNGIDLAAVLGQWGPVNQFTVTDFNRDGIVDGVDLGQLLGAWGPCP